MHRRIWFGLAALGLGFWSPKTAHAQAIDEDLWVANDAVHAVVREGGTIYIGGGFDFVGPPTGGGGPIDIATGTLHPSFPRVEGQVMAAVSDGAGGWYIGGFFSAVGGIPRSNIARVASDMSVTAWNPGANSAVRALAVSGSTVYAGGDFTGIGGAIRLRIAALDATTGNTTGWNPNANSTVYALAVSGSTVYAGGFFTIIGGQTRNYIGALDATTGNATGWNPNAGNGVFALAVSGSTIYAGGQFASIGVSTRNNIAAIDAATGTATAWDPNPNSMVFALAVDGGTVYAGGFFTFIGGQARSRIAALDAGTGNATSWDPLADNDVVSLAVSGGVVYAGGNFTNIGGQARSRVAAIDAITGLATSWNPGAGARVEALAVSGSSVWVGGNFNTVGGKFRRGIAALDAATGAATAWNPNSNGSVVAIAVSGNTVYVGGGFTLIGGQPRNRIAALDATTANATSWNPNASQTVNALAVRGTTVYAGGAFSTIGGQTRNRIAALDATTGLATSWNPNANSTVLALAAPGSVVYAAGGFNSIGGQTRFYIAALDPATGNATSWNPNPDNWVHALAVSGSFVYAGGNFTTIGGQSRFFIARLDGATGAATGWDPSANGEVAALAVSGSTVYAGGNFTGIGGQSRNRIAALSSASGSALSWNPNANGMVRALEADGGFLYAGGDFTSIATPPRSRFVGIEQTNAISQVEPDHGGDAGAVSVVISGIGFDTDANAKLVLTGQPDILGTQVSVAADGRSLTATFNLGGRPHGAWDVIVTNPDFTFASLPGGFTIEAMAAPQLRVDVIGPALFRTGYATGFDVVIQNSGNIDALGVPLWIAGIPANATIQLDFPLAALPSDAGEPDWSQLPQFLTSATGGRYLALVIPRVPPGTTTRRIYLNVPTTASFQLIAAVTPPWVDGTQFRTCIADGGTIADVACMGGQLTAINAYLAGQPQMEALNGIGVWAKIGWQCEGASSLAAALAEAQQTLDLMLHPVEQQGAIPPSCSVVLGPRWREVLALTAGSSFDPNDKIGNSGSGSSITSQQILSYSIRFENLSSASFPAQEVVVTDVIEPDLDPATISLGTITFGKSPSGTPYHLFPPPGQSGYTGSLDLRPAQNLIVQVNAFLSGNTLSWYFASVDPNGQPLPPSAGFLPPNVNAPEGEGSVVFTIRPRPGLPVGTQVSNSATLVFDNNPAMSTPAWTNSLDDSPPASNVQPIGSPQGAPTFNVSWTASGTPSDLRDFTVCVSEDGGPFRPWRLNTTATSDTFAAAADHQPHTYAFYSVARDQVGNMEAPPASPDAQTLSTVAVEEVGPWRLALEGARPNPVTGTAHVWFTLPSHERAVLEVLDVAGRRLLRREVGELGPGRHFVDLTATLRKPGLYFVRLAHKDHVLRSKLAVIR